MLFFNKIAIASDHGGFALKKKIIAHFQHIGIMDFGTNDSSQSVDYPDYAKKIAEHVVKYKNTCGILVCRSGVGMSIAANKFKGIRALLSDGNVNIVKLSREHNDCNVLCFGEEYIPVEKAIYCIEIFIQTPFLGERHKTRVNKIE